MSDPELTPIVLAHYRNRFKVRPRLCAAVLIGLALSYCVIALSPLI